MLILGFAVVTFLLGYGFFKLDSRVRIPAGILAACGLAYFPIGTLGNAFILFLIFSPRGKIIFSKQYKEIIERATYVKCITSAVGWIMLIGQLALSACGIMGTWYFFGVIVSWLF
jgi:branched-subunit amino acid transport protein